MHIMSQKVCASVSLFVCQAPSKVGCYVSAISQLPCCGSSEHGLVKTNCARKMFGQSRNIMYLFIEIGVAYFFLLGSV